MRSKTGFKVHFASAVRAQCNRPGSEVTLKACGGCGMIAYCGVECQKAAWREHKLFCRLVQETRTADDGDGKRRILFSRSFGGAASMLARQGQKKYGRGFISAVCSHRYKEFCGRSVLLTTLEAPAASR